MSKQEEKILSPIKLKYFINDKPAPKQNVKCGLCGKSNILVGAIDNTKKGMKFYCEDCAIESHRLVYGYKNTETAKAARRRMFDVRYLFNEMFIDRFMKDFKIKSFKELSFEITNELIDMSNKIYDQELTPKQKEHIEKINDQAKIEAVFTDILDFLEQDSLKEQEIEETESKWLKEYFDAHKILPKKITPDLIAQAKELLVKPRINKEDRKKAIITLAHVGTEDAANALDDFAIKAKGELLFWANNAIGECLYFLDETRREKNKKPKR